MTYKIRVTYSIQGTVCTENLESEIKPGVEIHPGTRTGIINLDEKTVIIYGDVWKIERISE